MPEVRESEDSDESDYDEESGEEEELIINNDVGDHSE